MFKKKILVAFILVWIILSFIVIGKSEATIYENENISVDTIWSDNDVHLITKNLAVNAGVTLTIEAGTVVKFNPGTNISVNQGTFVAKGDESNKIIFTSYRDDEFGGDTNEDGPSQGQPGDWDRIYFNNAFSNLTELENCIIRFGGSSNQGCLHIVQSNIAVISSEISQSSSYGIYTNSSSSLIENNTISNNDRYGIYHVSSSPIDRGNTITGNSYGIYVYNASPTIEVNTIINNRNWGIYYYSAQNAPVITGNIITHII